MGADHELRTEYLRLRAALYDPNTDLSGLPAVHDGVRALFELGRHVGVVHGALAGLSRIEAIYGWQATDRLLSVAGAVLRASRGSTLPERSVLAPGGIYGGSFAAFIPVPPEAADPLEFVRESAARLGARYLERFDTPEFTTMSPHPEFRLGHAVFTNEPFFRLERIVYRALEEASRSSMRGEDRRRGGNVAELRRILEEGDIEVVFQPIVHLEDSRIIGYEAFCRGPRDSALERPQALFDTSREVSAGLELDLLCQRRALEGARRMGPGVKLFLNALPASLLDPEFRDHLLRDLPQGLPFKVEDIVIEIAERDAIGDYRQLESDLGELRTRGIRIGVDDVGTGSGSFQTIAEVRPDYIKVDGSLIRDIQHSLVKQEMLRSLSKVAHSIEATLVAEGIESGEELAAIRECGVEYGQGFLFAIPRRELPAILTGTRSGGGTPPL